jgi:hypothetical protein
VMGPAQSAIFERAKNAFWIDPSEVSRDGIIQTITRWQCFYQ